MYNMKYLTCLFNNYCGGEFRNWHWYVYIPLSHSKLSINLICSKLLTLIAVNFTNAEIFIYTQIYIKEYATELHNIVHNAN